MTYTHYTEDATLACFTTTWPPTVEDILHTAAELHARAAALQKSAHYNLSLGPDLVINSREFIPMLEMGPFQAMAKVTMQGCIRTIQTAMTARTAYTAAELAEPLATLEAALKAYGASAEALST